MEQLEGEEVINDTQEEIPTAQDDIPMEDESVLT